jgi:hypothetical protein
MRELTVSEIGFVGGGAEQCSSNRSGNNYGGITDVNSVGKEIIAFYEGLIAATSYVIERVATSLD